MESTNEIIQLLRAKLDKLKRQQAAFGVEFEKFERQVQALERRIALHEASSKPAVPTSTSVPEVKAPKIEEQKPIIEKVEEKKKPIVVAQKTAKVITPRPDIPQPKKVDTTPSSFERFVGENLASKIGIVIIIIGVGIGVKYAINNDLLGPTMRIVLGYLVGTTLLGVAALLRKKYDSFSAVLFGGGMAIAYFVTFLAYDFYGIYSKMGAFGTMFAMTVVTTLAAIKLDKQIIAIIGLTGAYGVPFLLNDGTGSIWAMFSYMTILSLGVLFLSFFKGWKALQAVTFGMTWFIFGLLLVNNYLIDGPEDVYLVFAPIFYVIFYIATIAYKLKHREKFDAEHIAILMINTVVAYSIGITLVESIYDSALYSGLFTIGFALTHVVSAVIAKSRKEADIRLFYFSFGLALIFATITIPVILDGQWITMMWFLEALLLYWIGRVKNTAFYEKTSFIPLGLALVSMLILWTGMNDFGLGHGELVVNNYFLTGMLFSLSLFLMSFIKHSTDKTCDLEKTKGPYSSLGDLTMYLFLAVFYFTCYFEIDAYWSTKYVEIQSLQHLAYFQPSQDLHTFKVIWTLIFTMGYVSVMHIVNVLKFKNKSLATALGIVSSILLFIFLTIGLYMMSKLRDRALEPRLGLIEGSEGMYMYIRYIGFIALAGLAIVNNFALRKLFDSKGLHRVLEVILNVTFIWFMSSEVIHWKRMNGGDDYYRTALSILWGLYSLGLIAYGIWKRKPHIRLIAIIIFGVTLIKLFVYDIADASSGAKTIAFISLGVLLLIISFLYTKYRHLIIDEEENPEKIES